jgi:hypothetical protein
MVDRRFFVPIGSLRFDGPHSLVNLHWEQVMSKKEKNKPRYSDTLSDPNVPLVDRLKLCDTMLWSILTVGVSSTNLCEHQYPDSSDFQAASRVIKDAVKVLKSK